MLIWKKNLSFYSGIALLVLIKLICLTPTVNSCNADFFECCATDNDCSGGQCCSPFSYCGRGQDYCRSGKIMRWHFVRFSQFYRHFEILRRKMGY